MDFHGFEIDPDFVHDGVVDWKITGSGSFITATKGGKGYFLKRSNAVRYPDKSLPTASYNAMFRDFKEVRDKQEELANRMSSLSVDKDRIVRELDHFLDGCYFVTVTNYFSSSVPVKDAGIADLSQKNYLTLVHSMAEDLAKLHAVHVIHGDIKPENFIYVKKGPTYDAYEMDFDIAYPDDKILSDLSIGGSEGYMAPELLDYIEGEGDVPPTVITPKVDVFSLGVVFHFLWTNEFPQSGKYPSVAEALQHDGAYRLDPKFDFKIAEGVLFSDLLKGMLEKDSKKRLSSQDVLDILDGKKSVSGAEGAAPAGLFLPELWEEDSHVAELLTKEELSAKGVSEFHKEKEGTAKIYVVKDAAGEKKLTLEQLVAAGYAKKKEIIPTIAASWDKDRLVFADKETLAKKGIAEITTSGDPAHPTYVIVKISGLRISMSAKALIDAGLASKNTPAGSLGVVFDDAPWPEDGTHYDEKAARARHFVQFHKIEAEGEKRYEGIKEDGTKQIMRSNIALLYGVVKK
jgi:serine/threonine protein kinase